jgi:hypothetical protein
MTAFLRLASIVLGVVLTSAFAVCAFAQNCQYATIEGQVTGGNSFRQPLGNGLVFRLDAFKDNFGWQIAVSPENSTDDWAYPVNPPLRSENSEWLGTGYGDIAREVLSYPHEVRFLLNRTDYSRMIQLATEALWPYMSKEPEKAASVYLDALKTVRTGSLLLTTQDYDRSGPPETVAWMKFSILIVVPKGFRGYSGLHWTPSVNCDLSSPTGKPH